MTRVQRRQWSAEEKMAILEEARRPGQTVRAVCRQYDLAEGQFYAWEKQAREAALLALTNRKPGRKPKSDSE